ncbi:hypothetical protein SAMN05421819_4038 [Bryocella elongata]|uniref:Antitoxin n=1 Tax=Bryocella elongata TaxID=863522 RepID=A0A1H6BYE1_9BACT|nr:hypothetical protein [Bryocella elongata]SEG65455.1 hypothetical protein SAMN05421819_4038 [Bryocella elongata]
MKAIRLHTTHPQRYNRTMATIHIPIDEAVRDLRTVLSRLTSDTSVVIERDSVPVAVLTSPTPEPRSLAECIALLESKEQAVQDETFAEDVAAGIALHRESLDSSMILHN